MAVIDLEVSDEQVARRDRVATAMHKTRREATAQLIEEALRHEEFPCVEFRDSVAGRQAYVVGSGLAVWEFIMVAESCRLEIYVAAVPFDERDTLPPPPCRRPGAAMARRKCRPHCYARAYARH